MTSLWKMTQISKLKAGSFVEAGTGIPLNSESPSHGLTFHPPGTVAVGAASGSRASGHWHGACAAHSGWLSGTVRDYGQGLGIRGQLLDWPGQGPVPGPGTITGAVSAFWGSSFNDGTTQTVLDPLGGGAGSHPAVSAPFGPLKDKRINR